MFLFNFPYYKEKLSKRSTKSVFNTKKVNLSDLNSVAWTGIHQVRGKPFGSVKTKKAGLPNFNFKGVCCHPCTTPYRTPF